MKITFIGATHEVTGSCTLLENGGKYYLVDKGMEQGVDLFENIEIPVAPSDIDAVVVTHAHIDHTGKMVITLPEGWWGRKFHDGVAQTLKYDSCFVIDKTGKRLFQVNRDIVYTGNDIIYSHGLAVVIGKSKYEHIWGLMDKRGRITFCLDEDD